MLNERCVTNKYTRNLGIRIRTFFVVPLQEKGGIIEWVPNVTTFGDFVNNGSCSNRSELDNLRNQLRQKVILI
jgi:phosphatidylinositol kinase/protein kinase (PI-3  family)